MAARTGGRVGAGDGAGVNEPGGAGRLRVGDSVQPGWDVVGIEEQRAVLDEEDGRRGRRPCGDGGGVGADDEPAGQTEDGTGDQRRD